MFCGTFRTIAAAAALLLGILATENGKFDGKFIVLLLFSLLFVENSLKSHSNSHLQPEEPGLDGIKAREGGAEAPSKAEN